MSKVEYSTMTEEEFDEFTFEEDYIIAYECEDCGHFEETDEEFTECSECDSEDVTIFTSHEDLQCLGCDKTLDVFEDVYTNGDGFLCVVCYESKKNQLDKYTKRIKHL